MAETAKTSGKAGSDEDAAAKREAEKQAAADAKAREEAEAADPKYSTEELIASARDRLGVSPHAVAGALHKGAKEHFTIPEAEARVEEFLSSETDHAYEAAS